MTEPRFAPEKGVGAALSLVTSPPAAAPPAAASQVEFSGTSGIMKSLRVRAPTEPLPPEVLARAAAGDRAAFRTLFQRHRDDVARVVFRMMGARSDLEDVVQEVFVQVFRSLRDFRGQARFTTWLHRVTVNVVLMQRRSERVRPIYAEEQPGELVADTRQVLPDEDAAQRERLRAFARLLDRLPEKKRVVFVLHDLEGMAPAEIAKIVNAPVLTVRTRLFYARRELEALMAEEPALATALSEGMDGGPP